MSIFSAAHAINQDILAGTMVAVGLFVCFFGSKFFKQIIFFVGFLLGALMTYYAVPLFFSWFSVKIADDTLLYMCLTVGALCGILLVVVYKVAVFSCGAVAGAIFSQIVWICVIAVIDAPEEDWMSGVQVAVLIAGALIGGYLAFKFVEQVLKAVTAFIGGFMFASGLAFFIAMASGEKSKNIIDWVSFFGSSSVYNDIESVCDVFCIICIMLWLTLFAAGCFVQYKLHKRHKRKHNDEDESDSEYDSDSDSESQNKSKKNKRKKHATESDSDDGLGKKQNEYYEPTAPSYAPSGAGSIRSSGVRKPPGSAPTVAMSNYGANYYNGNAHVAAPGTAAGSQYGDYGQRTSVQYV